MAWPSEVSYVPSATSVPDVEVHQLRGKRRADLLQPDRADHVLGGVLHITRAWEDTPAGWADCRAFPAGNGSACDKFSKFGGGHGGQLLEHRVHQDVSAIKKHALVQRRALVRNRLLEHLRQLVIGERAVGSAGVGEAGGLESELAPVVASVGAGFEVGKSILLEQSSVRGSATAGSLLVSDRARDLPSGKLRRKNREDAGAEVAGVVGVAAGDSPAKATPTLNANKTRTEVNRKNHHESREAKPCNIRLQREAESFHQGGSWSCGVLCVLRGCSLRPSRSRISATPARSNPLTAKCAKRPPQRTQRTKLLAFASYRSCWRL